MPRLLETFLTLLSWIDLYWLTITNYGKPASLLATDSSLLASVPLAFLVVLLVHVISTRLQPMRLSQTDIVSIAILCLPLARRLRRHRHSYNFGDRSDFALYHRDFRNCTLCYNPPSRRILCQMEVAHDRPTNTVYVHRSLKHIKLVLLPHTPTDLYQTVSSHLVDAVPPSRINVAT